MALRTHKISGRVIPRSSLRAACRLYGGIKAVAQASALTTSALSGWFKGKTSVSDGKIEYVLENLDLASGRPSTDKVLIWATNTLDRDLPQAFSLYFGDGLLLAPAGWSLPGLKNFKKLLMLGPWNHGSIPPEILMMTDGNVRAVVYSRFGVAPNLDDMPAGAEWKNGDRSLSTFGFDPESDKDAVLAREVSQELFDRCWNLEHFDWEQLQENARKVGWGARQLNHLMYREIDTQRGR